MRALAITTVFFIFVTFITSAEGKSPSIRDPRQFRFGFEPTLTNLPMLLENGKHIARKFLTGKGEGVLSDDMPVGEKYRQQYIKILRERCPECVIKEFYDSHAQLTYHIEYPDGYYIRSSKDSGALEWQTKPSTIPEIKAHTGLHQRDIFDYSKSAGAGKRIKITGGHATFSGFGDDTFWYGNYLKFRTKNTDLDWGFFGKDSYNANPVQRWAPNQQILYQKVHEAHDGQWRRFLKNLEQALDKRTTDRQLMKIYRERKLMSTAEYAEKLLEIYHNPKQEYPRLGMRSKQKYVANRPDARGLIENRAIDPQANAEELVKMAEFMEAEAWYVKEQLNDGLELKFDPNAFTPNSRKVAARHSRKVIEDLGLKWKDYIRFSKRGDVALSGKEKKLADDFTRNPYGSQKRDELFRRLRDRFLSKPVLSGEESVFLADLLSEMSHTIPESLENASYFNKAISPDLLKRLPSDEANALIGNARKWADKFPAAAEEVLAPIQNQIKEYVWRALSDDQLTEARDLVPLLRDREQVLQEAILVHRNNPKASQWGLYADLLMSESTPAASKQYLEALSSALSRGSLTQIPARFHEVVERAKGFIALKPLIRETTEGVARAMAELKEPHLRELAAREADLLHWLAKERPQYRDRVFAPLRDLYEHEIRAEGYGRKNAYHTIALFDYLDEVTPEAERAELRRRMVDRVSAAFLGEENHPDRSMILDRVEPSHAPGTKAGGSAACGSRFADQLKKLIRRK